MYHVQIAARGYCGGGSHRRRNCKILLKSYWNYSNFSVCHNCPKEIRTITRNGEKRNMEQMNMQENARLVLGLRATGWSEKKVNDFILYIETGEEQYKPEPDAKEKAE